MLGWGGKSRPHISTATLDAHKPTTDTEDGKRRLAAWGLGEADGM